MLSPLKVLTYMSLLSSSFAYPKGANNTKKVTKPLKMTINQPGISNLDTDMCSIETQLFNEKEKKNKLPVEITRKICITGLSTMVYPYCYLQ